MIDIYVCGLGNGLQTSSRVDVYNGQSSQVALCFCDCGVSVLKQVPLGYG